MCAHNPHNLQRFPLQRKAQVRFLSLGRVAGHLKGAVMGFSLALECRVPSLLVIAFFCIVNSFFLWLRRAFLPVDSESSSSSEIPSSAFSGPIRENLPVLSFRKFAERNCEVEETIVCAICLMTFEEEDEIRELRNCGHVFHRDCLDKWVDHSHNTCPMCRSPLVGKQGSEAGSDGEVGAYLFPEDLNFHGFIREEWNW